MRPVRFSRMSIAACWLVLSVFSNSCLAAVTPGVPMTNRLPGEPPIRIGVRVGVSRVNIAANGGLTMAIDDDGGTARSRPVIVEYVDGGIRVDGSSVAVRGKIRFAADRRGEYLTVDGTAYRGTVEVVRSNGALNVINVADIEEYLLSVVGSELWSRSEGDLAALQAQAVAARTYALRTAGRYRESGFDVRADVLDQAYAGVRAENGNASRAVRSTRGQVIVYDNELITAFYHSTRNPPENSVVNLSDHTGPASMPIPDRPRPS